MTAVAPPLPPPSRTQTHIAMVASLIAIAVAAGSVVFAAGVQAQQIRALEETTRPLRDGDLVQLKTDVAWIRRHLEDQDR